MKRNGAWFSDATLPNDHSTVNELFGAVAVMNPTATDYGARFFWVEPDFS
jgi:hypothetical protein